MTETQPPAGPGQIDDPELNARAQAKYAELLQAQADQLTVAQRLTRRALKETIKIPFEDDLGPFEIEIRIPMSAELDRLMALRKEIEDAETNADPAAAEAASLALFTQLAALATDPSLDVAFFQTGDFLGSDFGQIIKELLMEEQRRVTQAGSFRQGQGGR